MYRTMGKNRSCQFNTLDGATMTRNRIDTHLTVMANVWENLTSMVVAWCVKRSKQEKLLDGEKDNVLVRFYFLILFFLVRCVPIHTLGDNGHLLSNS